MEKISTLNELATFSQNEKTLVRDLFQQVRSNQEFPSKQSINNILNFSRALSVRKVSTVGKVELILN